MKHKRYIMYIVISVAAILLVVWLLYCYNYIPHKKYPSEAFGIEVFQSSVDMDKDGMDDQTDILNNAKRYVATEPDYKSKYYEGGYPDDGYGVCTDVVAFALLDAGYDLMELVQQDIAAHPEDYDIEVPDANIDFRRVRNLKVYFKNTAIPLTLDTTRIEQWQGGDIVIFERHIGIVSDNRNKNGVSFIIHNGNPIQASYEEDVLKVWGEIVGHYRVSE